MERDYWSITDSPMCVVESLDPAEIEASLFWWAELALPTFWQVEQKPGAADQLLLLSVWKMFGQRV